MILVRRLPAVRYVPWLALCKAMVLVLLAALALPAWAGSPRVVAIGDSLTHGYGLPPAEGFVPQLEAWLAEQGHAAEVVNMGVSGDTTEGGRARLGWALGDGADAVIVWLGGNDLLRGIDPARSRDNLAAMAAELEAGGLPLLIISMRAPLNYGPDFQQAFDAMYGDVAAEHGALLLDGVFEGLVGTDMMQSDGIHPNAKGVAQIVGVVGPRVLDLLGRVEK